MKSKTSDAADEGVSKGFRGTNSFAKRLESQLPSAATSRAESVMQIAEKTRALVRGEVIEGGNWKPGAVTRFPAHVRPAQQITFDASKQIIGHPSQASAEVAHRP